MLSLTKTCILMQGAKTSSSILLQGPNVPTQALIWKFNGFCETYNILKITYFGVLFTKGFPLQMCMKWLKNQEILVFAGYLYKYSIFLNSVFFRDSYGSKSHYFWKIVFFWGIASQFEQKNRPFAKWTTHDVVRLAAILDSNIQLHSDFVLALALRILCRGLLQVWSSESIFEFFSKTE